MILSYSLLRTMSDLGCSDSWYILEYYLDYVMDGKVRSANGRIYFI